jgi:hypothetical protein
MTDFEYAFDKVSKLVNDFKHIVHKCESLDQQIDSEIYKLYGLIDVEIKIVKGK